VTLLITGADGQLGRALRKLAPGARFTTRNELDLTDPDAIDAFDMAGITGIINAAAYTAVDNAEDDVVNAWAINATAVQHLAVLAQSHDIPLLQVSTDYVFGEGFNAPIPVDAPTDPKSEYGKSKLAGELAAQACEKAYVVRTAWVFGDGHNFIRTMLRLSKERDEVSVVDDQYGRPTHADDLAAACLRLLADHAPGTYHATGQGDVVSWAEVASVVLAGTTCKVRRISSEEYPTRAPRPRYSALEVSTEVANVMRDWRVAVADYLAKQRVS
jgi:dTDP-4-dehydrorhamnose reductase